MAPKPSYELIDHTADMGVRVFGRSARDVFQNAALALVDQLVQAPVPRERQTRHLDVDGGDRPDLMVNWLREILYLWVGENRLVRAVRIATITETRLAAQVETELYSRAHHVIQTEIKAVTYHQIQVYKKGRHWEARIIFDT